MTAETTAPAATTPTATPKKTAKPKAKAAAKKATPAANNGHRKEGLRKPAIRILHTLVKAKNGLTFSEISEKAHVVTVEVYEHLGSPNLETRKRREKIYGPSLLTRKYATAKEIPLDGKIERRYTATKLGIAALMNLS